MTVHADVEKYILKIVRATREHPFLELGLSSRAALAILQAARTKAYIEGKDYVTPDDVKSILPPAALHRMELSTEGVLTKTIEEVLEEITNSITAPLRGDCLMKWIRYEHGFRSIHQGMAITGVFFVFCLHLFASVASCLLCSSFCDAHLSEHLFFEGRKGTISQFSVQSRNGF